MIKSMTAFGRARKSIGGKDITVEIRSVNNRFFDCSVKLPRSFSFLEEKIKPYLQSKSISRGKVDVYIGIDVIDSPVPDITVDKGYAAAYINALEELSDSFPVLDRDISVMRVAQNHDIFVIRKSDENTEKEWADVREVLDEALERFIAARQSEGNNIERDIKNKVNNIEALTEKIESISSSDITGYREKLEARLRDMLSEGGKRKTLYAVGDYENDLEMLRASDVAVCPSNALDKIKDICDLCLCDNDTGVIADLIEYIDKNTEG